MDSHCWDSHVFDTRVLLGVQEVAEWSWMSATDYPALVDQRLGSLGVGHRIRDRVRKEVESTERHTLPALRRKLRRGHGLLSVLPGG